MFWWSASCNKENDVSESKLVMAEKGKGRAFRPKDVWALLGWVGLTFLIIGGFDFALTWVPTNFGNREWAFGTVTQSFNGLPIVVLGLGLLLASSILTDRTWLAWVAAIGAFGLLVWVLVGAVIWSMTVSIALSSTPEEVLLGIKKAIAKTAMQSVLYSVLLGYMTWRAVGAVRGFIGSGRDT